VEIEAVAELKGTGLVGTRNGDTAMDRLVTTRASLAQGSIDRGQGLCTDASDGAWRELGTPRSLAEEASPAHLALQLAQENQRLDGVVGEQIPQLIRSQRLQLALGEIPRQPLQRFDLLADLLGGPIVRRLGAAEAPPLLPLEVLQCSKPLELREQLLKRLTGLGVLELVVAKALDGIGEDRGGGS
jgi:hypothetical protein